MRKLRLQVALPTLQFIVATVLLEWSYRAPWPFPRHGDELYVPTSRMICIGVNAPAWLLGLLVGALPLPDIRVFLLHTTDLELLAAVAVVWYLVARTFDQRASRQRPQVTGMPLGTAVWDVLLIVAGLSLFVSALAAFRSPGHYSNPAGTILEGLLFLVWSAVLMLFSGLHITRAVGRARGPSRIDRGG